MKLQMFKPYRYSILVEAVKEIMASPSITDIGGYIVGRNVLIFENDESQSGSIMTFVLIGTMAGEGLYRLVYSDFHT